MKKSTTRRALFLSFVSMFLCFVMLVGTTYAWFSDEVTSATNTITAGNLDVELYHSDKAVTDEVVSAGTTLFDDVAIWEPGAMACEMFTVENKGDLALKYLFTLNVAELTPGFAQMLKVAKVDADFDYTRPSAAAITEWNTLATFNFDGDLFITDENGAADTEDTFGIVIYWEPSQNDNNFNGVDAKVNVGVNLFATQAQAENDSFGGDYDYKATFPSGGSGVASAPAAGQTTTETEIRNEEGTKVGYSTIPTEAIEDPTKPVEVRIEPTTTNTNITIDTGRGEVAKTIEITVTNIKSGNTAPITHEYRLGEGYDPTAVKLYHYDDEIASSYNPNTGYITFNVTDHSPFTVVYNPTLEYVAPEATPEDLPEAKVEEYDLMLTPGYATGEDAPEWGQYGDWSPVEGLDSKLETAFVFACTETLEEANLNPYAYWLCDFYVMLDKDLGENEIFLGGYYDVFGAWVGFHNRTVTLEANDDLGLLEAVLGEWTYVDVVQNVREFVCGVGDVDNKLADKDATFTVMLRVTNPDDKTEAYNVATVTYNFASGATTVSTTPVAVK